jgi:hypothetical protein
MPFTRKNVQQIRATTSPIQVPAHQPSQWQQRRLSWSWWWWRRRQPRHAVPTAEVEAASNFTWAGGDDDACDAPVSPRRRLVAC